MFFDNTLHDPVLFAVPAFVVFMALELLSLRLLEDDEAGAGAYELRDTRVNLIMGAGSVFVSGGARLLALFGYSALYEVTPLRLDPRHWTTWVGVLLLVDLLWYLYHRASHRVRVLWAGHQAHHSSQHFNYSVALRQKWNPWGELLYWTPLPLLGVPPWMIYTAFSFNLVFQFLVHTERVGRLWAPIEFVFNTPSHHRVHHASDKEYLDRNYAGILILWDRLFGTFAAETHRPRYGLTTNVDTFNPLRLQYHEYAAMVRDVKGAGGVRAKLGHVFGPPGWSPQPTISTPVEGLAAAR